MPELKDKIDALIEASAGKVPEASVRIMHDATEQLASSGLPEQALSVGESMPNFQATDSSGTNFDSSTADRPLVVGFFRGHW